MGASRVRRGTTARHAESVWARDWALPDAPPSDYAFLVDRLVDRATLDRAEALAKKWGVLPHAVMIANGWLSESDYYRALARESGVPFQDDIAAHEVTAPASLKSPRECLARGLLKRRARHGAYVYAPERLRPSTVEHVLAQIGVRAVSADFSSPRGRQSESTRCARSISRKLAPPRRVDETACAPPEAKRERELAAFRQGPPNLACLQAKLNLYNGGEAGGWPMRDRHLAPLSGRRDGRCRARAGDRHPGTRRPAGSRAARRPRAAAGPRSARPR